MKEIGLFEAKTRLSELCAMVEEAGEEFIITRRGKPVARLAAPPRNDTGESLAALPIAEAVAAWSSRHSEPASDFPDVWLERQGAKPSPFEQKRDELDGPA